MPIEINGQVFYSSKEVAERLGTTRGMIRYWLSEGRIEGQKIGGTTYFTEEQVQAADTEARPRGPKRKKKSDSDVDEESSSSVMLMGRRRYNACLPVGA